MGNILEKAESAIKLLRKEGLRVTEQRKAILNVLAHADAPLSAEENHANLNTEQCDLVTVYRCLEQFAKKGIVDRGKGEWDKSLLFRARRQNRSSSSFNLQKMWPCRTG